MGFRQNEGFLHSIFAVIIKSSQISIELFTYNLLCYAEENLVQQSPSSISSDTKGNAKVERSVDDDDFLGADDNGIRKKKGR